jgi:hypothetical protein
MRLHKSHKFSPAIAAVPRAAGPGVFRMIAESPGLMKFARIGLRRHTPS